ncbi:MAG: magnesium/cobalt transporter CorA [Candidatus Electronema sp. V4]|uniref:magnesium/cobalt transporter CorA n=1 Tax=Candidatus Electronema sp. V4 TaxID=3454756 RepID=UPI0040556D75
MSRSARKKKKGARGAGIKSGMAPGTMVFIGEQKQDKARIDVIRYTETELNELHDATVQQCGQAARQAGIAWLNVSTIHDIKLIEALGKCFDLHPMTLEDIVNSTQRPKLEVFPEYLFIVLKMMTCSEETGAVSIEHVSLILGKGYVISFLEDEGDVFDTVRSRIRSATGRIRSMQADYLAYSLMDAVVDQYFLAVERIGDRIEEIDEQILSEPRPEHVRHLHQLKRSILNLRRAVWPFREEVSALARSESALIYRETKVFWRDLYDHAIRIIDMVEVYRDILGGMHDTYLTSISNRMNEVMKMLTIISTIFIPLTFVVGVYGMNFEHMPELKWHYGYCLIWAVMLVTAIGLFVYFKRKKWL